MAFVLLAIAIFYFTPIIPAELCPSIIGKCASMGEGNMSLPNLIESWISFFLP